MKKPIFDAVVLGGKPSLYSKIMSLSPDLYWPLNDTTGAIIREVMGKTSDTLVANANGGFETDGAGGADVFASWTETYGTTGVIAKETTIVHEGGSTASCKITQATPAVNVNVSTTVGSQRGRTYEVSFWTRGDGTNAGRYAIYAGAWIVAFNTTTGVTGTTWTKVTQTFTVSGSIGDGAVDLNLYLSGPAAAGGVAYFDDVTITGKNFTQNGYLTGTGSTLNSESIGKSASIAFNGSGFVNINAYGAPLAGLFDRSAISILIWAKAGFDWGVTASNYDLWGINSSASETFVNYHDESAEKLSYTANGGGNHAVLIDDVPSGWFSSIFVVADATIKPYYNGDARTTTAAGTFASALKFANIGNTYGATAFHAWVGNLAHMAIWFRELSASEIALVGKL